MGWFKTLAVNHIKMSNNLTRFLFFYSWYIFLAVYNNSHVQSVELFLLLNKVERVCNSCSLIVAKRRLFIPVWVLCRAKTSFTSPICKWFIMIFKYTEPWLLTRNIFNIKCQQYFYSTLKLRLNTFLSIQHILTINI